MGRESFRMFGTIQIRRFDSSGPDIGLGSSVDIGIVHDLLPRRKSDGRKPHWDELMIAGHAGLIEALGQDYNQEVWTAGYASGWVHPEAQMTVTVFQDGDEVASDRELIRIATILKRHLVAAQPPAEDWVWSAEWLENYRRDVQSRLSALHG